MWFSVLLRYFEFLKNACICLNVTDLSCFFNARFFFGCSNASKLLVGGMTQLVKASEIFVEINFWFDDRAFFSFAITRAHKVNQVQIS